MPTFITQEGDGIRVRVTWRDADRNPATPTTVRYRVDCLTTGQAVLSWVSVAPAQVTNILISGAAANQIVNPANESEVRQVTVQGNAGLPDQETHLVEYVVPNNAFV